MRGLYPCGTPWGGWCGKCYANRKKRANYRGHAAYVTPARPYVPPIWEVRQMQRPSQGDEGAGVPNMGTLLAACPRLWAMLTDSKWDDGAKRVRSTMLIVPDAGLMKVCLIDKATMRNAWAVGDTLEAAIEALEESLELGTTSWRAVEGEGRRKR